MAFESRLVCTREVGGEVFSLSVPLVYRSNLLSTPIIVPTGYETDFASIPRIARSLIPQVGKHVHAAVVHDYLCTDGEALGITQELADKIFYEAMEVCGVRWSKRKVMFRGVRAFQRLKYLFSRKSYD